MATSKFKATREALVTAITNQLATDAVTGVTVTKYVPTGNEATREDRVAFDEISITQSHMTMGPAGFREEIITITGVVMAFKAGGSLIEQEEAEDRAETIFASVENTIDADPDIASTVFHGEVVEMKSTPDFDEVGAKCVLEFTLSIEAHL